MELLLTVVLLAAVVAIVAAPLRRGAGARTREACDGSAVEAAKDAKYREILDTELDFRTGKLSEADYRDIDRGLRGEAVELLRRLDAEGTKRDRG